MNTFKEHVVLGNIFTSFRGQFFSCGAIAFDCTFFVFINKRLSDTQHKPDTVLDTMGKIARRKDHTYWAFTMFVLGICSLHRHWLVSPSCQPCETDAVIAPLYR